MKNVVTLSLIAFSGLLAGFVASCQPSKKPTATHNLQKGRIVTLEMPINGDFSQLTVISDMDVEMRLGPCKIEATGDSATLARLRYDIDSGGLIISNPADENADMNPYTNQSGISLVVWSPQWRIVANCSRGKLICHEPLRTSYFQLGGIHDGSILLDSVECDTFRYEGSRNSTCEIGFLRSELAHIVLMGHSTIKANIDIDTLLAFSQAQTSAMFTGRADSVSTYGNVTLVPSD